MPVDELTRALVSIGAAATLVVGALKLFRTFQVSVTDALVARNDVLEERVARLEHGLGRCHRREVLLMLALAEHGIALPAAYPTPQNDEFDL